MTAPFNPIKLLSKFIQESENPLLVGATWVTNGEWAIKQTALYHTLTVESAKKRYQAVAATAGIREIDPDRERVLDDGAAPTRKMHAFEALPWICDRDFPVRIFKRVDSPDFIGIKAAIWALLGAEFVAWHGGGIHDPVCLTPVPTWSEGFRSENVVAIVARCLLPFEKFEPPVAA